jgi:hypothetical protein
MISKVRTYTSTTFTIILQKVDMIELSRIQSENLRK